MCVAVALCVVGILYQVHKLDVRGRKVKMSIWVRRYAFFPSSERADCFPLRLLFVIYNRTLQAKNVSALSLHRITAERRASYLVRVLTALRFSFRGSQ